MKTQACQVQDNGGTFYHDGGGSLPTSGDGVFSDENGNDQAGAGYYFVNTSYVVIVNDSGAVSGVTTCGDG